MYVYVTCHFVSHKVNQFQEMGIPREPLPTVALTISGGSGVLSTERLWTGTRAGGAARQRVRAPVQSDGCWAGSW